MRQTTFAGLPVNVEIEVGGIRSGIGEDGEAWRHEYAHPYGEIQRTQGDDGDPVDVYLGPQEDAPLVFVIHQKRLGGAHDEDKVMLGFPDASQAMAAYFNHGPKWGFGSMSVMTSDEFKKGYLAATRDHEAAPGTPIGDEERGARGYGS